MTEASSESGRIAFLPWVKLPKTISVNGFDFVPLEVASLDGALPGNLVDAATHAIQAHKETKGSPINAFTLIRHQNPDLAWNISEELWPSAFQAAQLIALCALSEQEFLKGHFAPHLNATMFQPVSMSVSAASNTIGLYVRRRGGGLNIGGIGTKDFVFTEPPQVQRTECETIDEKLLEALTLARDKSPELARSITDSLQYFLLANAEEQILDDEHCLMLSAISFERLLKPNKSSAIGLAEAFDCKWIDFEAIPITEAKNIEPDNAWKEGQKAWSIKKKWMKELYEVRSSYAHRGKRSALSSNWGHWQHIVIAAFTYPLTVKLLSKDAGLYELREEDQVNCDVLDRLLISDWGKGWEQEPEWSSIIDEELWGRRLAKYIEEAMDEAGVRTDELD